MNKTIIININGIVFHIEEEAYELLQLYMIEVKKHFAYSKDNVEIVTDIENRIAEMLTERLASERKEVIVLADVEYVTTQMGSVADFETGEESPYSDYQPGQRKLYRDPEDRVIGGVCSGIAHYFDVEPKWIRVITFLVIFLGGSGLFIYAILWIVIPVAKTRSEKMAMKGEPLNLQNFKKNFDEEVEAVKENFSRAHRDARPALDNFGNFVHDLFHHLGKFLNVAFKVAVKIIGAFILFAGCMMIFGLVVAFLALLGFWNTAEFNYFPFNVINPEYQSAIYIGAFLFIIIPLVALILFAVRTLLNRRTITRTGAFAMLLLWLTGLFMLVYYGSRVGAEFAEEASVSQVFDIQPRNVYYLKLDPEKVLTKTDSINLKLGSGSNGKIVIDGDFDDIRMPDAVSLYIEKSDSGKPTLTEVFTSRGNDFKSALANAKSVGYSFRQVDSALHFNNTITFNNNELWRAPQVKLTLQIPVNSRLMIDSRINYFLENFNLWDCLPEGSHDNSLSEWVMTEEGLKCANDSLYKQNHDL